MHSMHDIYFLLYLQILRCWLEDLILFIVNTSSDYVSRLNINCLHAFSEAYAVRFKLGSDEPGFCWAELGLSHTDITFYKDIMVG